MWTLEYRPHLDAVESGMDAFLNWNKYFVGKEATERFKAEGPKQKLVTMTIDCEGIDVSNDEAILNDGTVVGYIFSGGYGYRVGSSLAMGYVAAEHAGPGLNLQVEILGEMFEAKFLGGPLYDANGANMEA